MSEFTKVGIYKNLRFERKFDDLELEVREVNPKHIHTLTGKSFDTEEAVNTYIEELTAKRPRFLTLSKTLDDKELKAVYGDEVKTLNSKPSEIKKFTVKSQYNYILSDEYFDLYKTFNSEDDIRRYLAEEFNLFVGDFNLTGDLEE